MPLVAWPDISTQSELWRYFYRSGDGSGSGGYWINRSQALGQLPHPYGWGGTWALRTQRGYNLTLAVNPLDGSTVYVGGVHLWRNPTGFVASNASDRIGGFYYDEPPSSGDPPGRIILCPASCALLGSSVKRTVEIFTALYRSQRDRRPVTFPLKPEEDRTDYDGRLL